MFSFLEITPVLVGKVCLPVIGGVVCSSGFRGGSMCIPVLCGVACSPDTHVYLYVRNVQCRGDGVLGLSLSFSLSSPVLRGLQRFTESYVIVRF